MKADQAISYKHIVPHGSGKLIATRKLNSNLRSSDSSNNGSVIEKCSPIIGKDASKLAGCGLGDPSTIHTASSSNGIDINPVTRIISPCSINNALIRAFVSRHFFSCSMAFSRDENCFVMALFEFGILPAAYLALNWGWRCERPFLNVCESLGLFPEEIKRYYQAVKSNPKTSDEYTTFENSLRTILSVPRSELQRREKEYQEQRKKKKRPKTSGVSRASNGKD